MVNISGWDLFSAYGAWDKKVNDPLSNGDWKYPFLLEVQCASDKLKYMPLYSCRQHDLWTCKLNGNSKFCFKSANEHVSDKHNKQAWCS